MGGKMSDETMRAQLAGVRVKGLGWRNLLFPVDCEAAKTPYGDYRVGPDEKVNGFYWLFDGEVRRGLYDDRDEAKAAAEADYRQRILSALETQEEEPWGYHNAMGQVFRSDELALQDEHVRSRFTEPLYTHPTPVQKEGEGQTVSEEMVEAGLAHYSEGGCSGLSAYERREVVVAILEAAFTAALVETENFREPGEFGDGATMRREREK